MFNITHGLVLGAEHRHGHSSHEHRTLRIFQLYKYTTTHSKEVDECHLNWLLNWSFYKMWNTLLQVKKKKITAVSRWNTCDIKSATKLTPTINKSQIKIRLSVNNDLKISLFPTKLSYGFRKQFIANINGLLCCLSSCSLKVLFHSFCITHRLLDNTTHLTRDRTQDLDWIITAKGFKTMDIPAVHLLLLEQGDRSLEDHMRDFLDLAGLTHYSIAHYAFSLTLASTSGRSHICPWMVLEGALPSICSRCW